MIEYLPATLVRCVRGGTSSSDYLFRANSLGELTLTQLGRKGFILSSVYESTWIFYRVNKPTIYT
jgi:hypothetical protein